MSSRLIVVVAALVVVLGLSGVGIAVLNSPENVAMRSVANFYDDFLARDEFATISKVLTGGSMEFSLSSVKEMDDDGSYEELFEDTSFAGKFYFNEDAIMLKDFDIKVEGTRIDGEAYFSKDQFYLQENRILKGAYGVDISKLAEELENSIFAPDSGSDYEMDEEIFDNLIETLNTINDEDLEKDLTKLVETVVKDALDIVMNNAEITSKDESVRIGGKKTDVRMISIVIDDKAMEAILNDLLDYLSNCDEIYDFMDKYNDVIVSCFGDALEGDSIEDLYDDFLNEFEEELDDIIDSLDDFEGITIKLATHKLKARLLQFEVLYDKDSLFLLDCGADGIKNSNKISIEVEEEKLFTYTVKENDKDQFVAELTFEDGPTVSIDIDKENEEYSITYEYSYSYDSYEYVNDGYNYTYMNYTYTSVEKYTLKGSISQDGDITVLTIDSLTNDSYSKREYENGETKTNDYSGKLVIKSSITLDTKDSMPKLADYDSISAIREKDIENWIEKFDDLMDI